MTAMNDPVLDAALKAGMSKAEVQQLASQVFGYLAPRFKPGYVFTLLAVHPQYHAHDVVCASSAPSKDALKPAAMWMQTYILHKVDRIVTASDAVPKAAPVKLNATPSDLAAVIRGALPFINTNGSERAIDMLRAALVAHASEKPDEGNE
jgi:hypothetical protein